MSTVKGKSYKTAQIRFKLDLVGKIKNADVHDNFSRWVKDACLEKLKRDMKLKKAN